MVTISADAVLLDMDGTLVDSDAVVERIMTRWALAHGVDPVEAVRLGHGRQGYEVMAELLPDRPMAQNHADNEEVLAQEVAETDGIVAIPGAADLLAALADVPHALVTSASRALAQARMAAAGLPIPAISVTADEVTESKPHPRGFLDAAARLGVDASRCIVLEDSAAGVAAGLAAGATVIGVGAATAEFGAHHTVDDLTEVTVSTQPLSIHLTEG